MYSIMNTSTLYRLQVVTLSVILLLKIMVNSVRKFLYYTKIGTYTEIIVIINIRYIFTRIYYFMYLIQGRHLEGV